MTDFEFWREVRKRRNQVFLCWAAWIPFGVAVVLLATALFGRNGAYAAYLALVVWSATCYWFVRRLGKLSCPRCEGPAIKHPFFFMRDAECQCCGLNRKKMAKL